MLHHFANFLYNWVLPIFLATCCLTGMGWIIKKSCSGSIKKFLLYWNEIITIPIGFLLVYYCEYAVTYFFPATPAYSPSFIYDTIYTIAAWLVLHGFAWLAMKLTWQLIERFFDVDFDALFFSLLPYEKIKVALAIYAIEVASIMLVALAVFTS